MSQVKIVDLKANVLEDNDILAKNMRDRLKKEKTFFINLMSSPGGGKTTTLLQTIKLLKDEYKVAIMEADIDSDVDALKIKDAGGEVIQLHTGGMCHLDAAMTEQGLRELKDRDYDIVFLENVGNLVCPAEFDTGASKNVCMLSVPEGDDKPLKYPLMFEVADAVLVNKTDTLPYFDFDMDKFKKNVHMRHPDIPIIDISAKTGDGMDRWISWVKDEFGSWIL